MRFILNLFIFFVIPICAAGQQLKLSIRPNPNSTLSLTRDSNFLVTSAGSDRISWVKSDLSEYGSKIIKTKLNLNIFECLSSPNGVFVSGLAYPKNFTETSPAWLLVAKLDSCMEPEWQKLIIFNEIYLDTQIVNNYIFTSNLTTDELGNLYVFVTNENSNTALNQPDINRVTSYVYKFTKNGKLLYRKPIIIRKHDDLIISSVSYFQGNLYLCGAAFFPLNGSADTTSSVFVSRGIIAKMDTVGDVKNLRIFENEKYYGNYNYNIYSDSNLGRLYCSQSGAFFKDSSYRVMKELTLDLNLDIIRSKANSEKDKIFSIPETFIKTINNDFFAIKVIQNTNQKGTIFSRTSIRYLYNFDSSLNVKDSFQINYFYPSNGNDSLLTIVFMAKNPLVDTIFTLFGVSNQNSSQSYYFALNINRKGEVIDSLKIENYPHSTCKIDYSESTIYLNSFDTIEIKTIYNQNFNEPYTNVKEPIIPNIPQLIPYPNPAREEVCFDLVEQITQVSLLDIQGVFVEDLIQVGKCFLISKNQISGIYILKVNIKDASPNYFKIIIN